jgi:acetyl esterase/lipase
VKRCEWLGLAVLLVAQALSGQQLDDVTKWATIAQNEGHVSIDLVYGEANNVKLRLDVITVGSPSVPKPTLIYFHGGGWKALRKARSSTCFLTWLSA